MDWAKINDAQSELNYRRSKLLWLLVNGQLREPSRRQRFVASITAFFERCRDAWLVLKGDAYISEGR